MNKKYVPLKKLMKEKYLREKKQLGVVTRVAKKAVPVVTGGAVEEILPVGGSFDPWGFIPDIFLSPNQSVPRDEMNPNGWPYNDQGIPEEPGVPQGHGGVHGQHPIHPNY